MAHYTLRILRQAGFFVGIALVVGVASIVGTLIIREAYSFVGPAQSPGAGHGPDQGVFGQPDDGIKSHDPAVDNLFKGQKKIYDALIGGGAIPVSVMAGGNPLVGSVPLTVAFAAAGSSSATSYSWNFGDGSPLSSEQNPTHVYANGSYIATVTASDGSAEATDRVTIEASLPTQCASYTTIDDATRNINNTVSDPPFCDSTLATGWYRFTATGNTTIPLTPPSPLRCQTSATGWMNFSLPASVGETANGSACFNWGVDTCSWSTAISATNCGGYYVYHLPPSPPGSCNLRYCTN